MENSVSQIKIIAITENRKCLCITECDVRWFCLEMYWWTVSQKCLCCTSSPHRCVCILAVHYYQHISVPRDNPQKRIFVFNVNTTFSRRVILLSLITQQKELYVVEGKNYVKMRNDWKIHTQMHCNSVLN